MLSVTSKAKEGYCKTAGNDCESLPYGVGGPYVFVPRKIFRGREVSYSFEIYYYYTIIMDMVPVIRVIINEYDNKVEDWEGRDRYLIKTRRYVFQENTDISRFDDEGVYSGEVSEDTINDFTRYFNELVDVLPADPDNYDDMIRYRPQVANDILYSETTLD